VYQSSQVYQDCTNSEPTVYQSSKTVKTQSKQHKMSRIHKGVCAYQQCCHLANGNKACPSLLVFKNNNNGAWISVVCAPKFTKRRTRVEQPFTSNQVLQKARYINTLTFTFTFTFICAQQVFCRITIFCRVRA